MLKTAFPIGRSEKKRLRLAFEEFLQTPDFPCVGAKSALARGGLKVLVCQSLRSGWDDLRIHDALLLWAWDYEKRSAKGREARFRSLAVIFADSEVMSEEEFETAMWRRIQSLAEKDAWRGQDYDRAVSPDPQDPHFSLSFGGQAFFVVGLHPGASRPARRFDRPALVFNLHDQFEMLRAAGKYETIRETIVARDVEFSGSPNPMLSRHGEASEARQYSGRHIPDDWQCPFEDPRAAGR